MTPEAQHFPPAFYAEVKTPIAVSSDSADPLYRQLRQALEHQILSGGLVPNLPLPSSRELARELGLSRNTVNAAYQELLASGMIESHSRRGYFINTQMIGKRQPRGEATPAVGSAVDWSRHIRPRLDETMPEITKVRDWAGYPYPFVAGQVDERDFPRLGWSRALRDALDPPHLFYSVRDSVDEDDPYLVETLCKRVLPTRGIHAKPENILITAGSQQGLDLLAQTMMGADTCVGVENPGYVDARHTFVRAGATLRPLPVDENGLVPPERLDGIDLLYLTPSHHSPTNVTLSGARRRQILAGARDAGALVIEDDYDSEFRYRGKPTPALKALPDSEHVIYLGSFTKFLAPGLRMGYMVAEAELIAELRNQRRYKIRHIPGHPQRAMALLIESGQYQRTISRRRTQLQRKWQVLTEALEEFVPWEIHCPPGGVSIWVRGPEELDCVQLAAEALKAGVVIERGDVFFDDPESNRNYFRLGFAAIKLEAIRPGIRELGRVIAGLPS
ncbi:PLP-dependent aminotransferase family protein [Paeniglutamicibacter kerguelensis]|uniref:GntR family transcriptional regulator/MocR family aminotransferase n=1 Tax=Paeniglutamicibacter kerguelensis TaxID=254788 RepID=A0ABS4XJI5_9MICC|nr:PLP-dependent aminotransferase family protein [Paeniglutamicibacter kerguelensis]MBP2388617.1 GntR family transcriptional regulator/MocR family aminotransferase [Paeniglutamicibacter kerguelensis]